MQLNILIIIVFLAVLSICAALVILFLYKLNFSVQGTLYWVFGFLTLACSFILFTFQGILPDFITIVFADTGIACGFSIILSGMRIFVGRSSRLKINFTIPMVIAPLMFWYSYVDISFMSRNTIMTVMIGAFSGAIAYELLRVTKDKRPAQRFVGYVFAVYAAFFLIHIILSFVYIEPSVIYMKSEPLMAGLLYLWSFIFLLLITSGKIMMVGEKLQAQQIMEEKYLKQSEKNIKKIETQLHFLTRRLIDTREEECKRISLELHDAMGQTLTAIGFNLSYLRNDIPDSCLELLDDTVSIVDDMSNQVRNLSHDLRPIMLDDLGLIPTLRWFLNSFTRRTKIKTKLEAVEFDEYRNENLEITIYRIVQEALNNVAKHAATQRQKMLKYPLSVKLPESRVLSRMTAKVLI
jgi:signal transduction histidine kinase